MIKPEDIISCKYHSGRQAWGKCDKCGAYLCEGCKTSVLRRYSGEKDRFICPACKKARDHTIESYEGYFFFGALVAVVSLFLLIYSVQS